MFVSKWNRNKSSKRRKQRRERFQAPSHKRRVLLSAPLSAELRNKHGVRAVPIRREDEVHISRGTYKGREGKVVQVYRKKWVIHVERITREKVNGATVNVGVRPDKVLITKLKMDKDRRALLDRRRTKDKNKNKFSEQDIQAMQDVD